MRVLFLTRKFPPQKGGMQKTAYELFHSLSGLAEVKLVKWGGSNKWLPLILPYFLLSSIYLMTVAKANIIYLQDGLLAPLGYVLKGFRKPVVITIHGLDITYENRLYRFLVPRCIRRLDRLICVSQSTKQECVKRRIPEAKVTVIPDSVSDQFYTALTGADRDELRKEVSRRFGFNLSGGKVILSVGRLMERKGFHWFVEEVMPKIIEHNQDCVYLIGGDGVYREKIKEAIERMGLQNKVFLLGLLGDEELRHLYNSADVYVMPNIPVEGDMEGFGLVALEAASCGLPVVASELEGIRDAVRNGENGLLVQPCKAQAFADTILGLLKDDEEREGFGKKARQYTLENFSSERMAERYLSEFQKVLEG